MQLLSQFDTNIDNGFDCKWSIPLPRHSREGLSRLGALDTASLTLGTKLVRHLGANMSFFSTKIEKMVLERKNAAVEDQPYVPKTTVVTREEIETIFFLRVENRKFHYVYTEGLWARKRVLGTYLKS